MAAAAHGRSNLDIPQKVGKDFMAADKAAGKKFVRRKKVKRTRVHRRT